MHGLGSRGGHGDTRLNIVPATREYFEALYGEPCKFTMRGFVTLEGDKPIGIAGTYKDKGADVAFIRVTPELKPRGIVKLCQRVKETVGKRVFAIRDTTLETSEGFLRHWGFKPMDNGVYSWNR